MTTSIRPVRTGGHGHRPPPAGLPAEQAEAVAWLRGHLRWEQRLTEVRRAYERTVPPADLPLDSRPSQPTTSRGARARQALIAVLLGASLTAGVLVLAPGTGKGSSSTPHGLTPVARPASGASFDTQCRPHGLVQACAFAPNTTAGPASAGDSGALAGPQAVEFGR
jgi:hypothetical protein